MLEALLPAVPAEQALADHLVCYPATDPGNGLEPMVPDRLAEDFLALTLPGHDHPDFAADGWSAPVPARLFMPARPGRDYPPYARGC